MEECTSPLDSEDTSTKRRTSAAIADELSKAVFGWCKETGAEHVKAVACTGETEQDEYSTEKGREDEDQGFPCELRRSKLTADVLPFSLSPVSGPDGPHLCG